MKKNNDFDFEELEEEFTDDYSYNQYDDDQYDTKTLRNSKPNTKNKKPVAAYFIAGVLSTVVIGGLLGGGYMYYKSLPQNTVQDYKEYFNDYRQFASVEDSYIKLDHEVLLQDDSVYVPIDFIKNYIDEYIFYEPNANLVTITNDANVIRMNTDEATYYVNDDPLSLTLPIVQYDNTAYLPIELVENTYNVSLGYGEDSKDE